MKTYNFAQQTDEWFEVRLGKLTASTAQAIGNNGKGLTTLVYTKVAEKLTGEREEGYSSADIDRGNEMEDKARKSYEVETGNKVVEVGFCELDEWTGASPDGLVGDDGLVEIKCPRAYKFIDVMETGKVEPKYMWQMQMQMYVTDRKWCDYVVYHDRFEKPIIIRVERDEKKIEKIKIGLESGINQIKNILEKVSNETHI